MSYAKAGTTSAPINEQFFNYKADSANCFRYDATLHGFFYSLPSSSITGASGGAAFLLTVTVTAGGGTAVAHAVTVAFK
ncbi:MAG: hypothetical protein ABJA34_01730 [Pseudonocardiales bacterium]